MAVLLYQQRLLLMLDDNLSENYFRWLTLGARKTYCNV
jgi:hypothetical protein